MKLPIKLAFGSESTWKRYEDDTFPVSRCDGGYRVLWASAYAYSVWETKIPYRPKIKYIRPKAAISLLVSDEIRSVFIKAKRFSWNLKNHLLAPIDAAYYRGLEDGRRDALKNPDVYEGLTKEELEAVTCNLTTAKAGND